MFPTVTWETRELHPRAEAPGFACVLPNPLRFGKTYTDLLSELGVHSTTYGKLTNRIYEGLFGLQAEEMRQRWLLMSGDPKVARNYISEERGIEAVKYCEDMVVRMYVDSLDEAHREAISLTIRKFKLRPQRLP